MELLVLIFAVLVISVSFGEVQANILEVFENLVVVRAPARLDLQKNTEVPVIVTCDGIPISGSLCFLYVVRCSYSDFDSAMEASLPSNQDDMSSNR